MKLVGAFAANFKGSDDLWDYMLMRVNFYGPGHKSSFNKAEAI